MKMAVVAAINMLDGDFDNFETVDRYSIKKHKKNSNRNRKIW